MIHEETLFRTVESTVIAVLNSYLYDRDRDALERGLLLLGELLSAQPDEAVRPLLTRTSEEIDGLLPFVGLWPGTSWRELFTEDCWCSSVAPAGRRKAIPDRDDKEDIAISLFDDDPSDCGDGNAEALAVPFVAFLLAGTGFPFTDEEIGAIRSGQGVSLADIIERERVLGENVPDGGSRRRDRP